MSLENTKRIIFLVVSILLLSFNSNTFAVVQLIPMQQIGEDTIGDEASLGYDILSAYAAGFDGLLMLMVIYDKVGDWGLFSNITLRNINGDLFLIMAASSIDNNFVVVTGATSLEKDSLNADEGGVIFYEETWRVNTNYTAITIFVDWIDIGGEGPIDLVFWTGRPFDNPDKLPNTGYLSFDSVKSVDTTGYLDNPARTTTTVIEEPTRTSEIDDGLSTITVSDEKSSREIDLNNTDTPDVQEEIVLTDLLPISNSFIFGLMTIGYLGYRKSRK